MVYSALTSIMASPDHSLSFLPSGSLDGKSVSFHNVSWALPKNGRTILKQMSFDLSPKKILGIVGPNGAGKSTLLRLLYRYYAPTTGTIEIDGIDIWKMKAKALARKVAAVLQEQPADFSLSVRDIVSLGRTPYRTAFGMDGGRDDKQVVNWVLEKLELKEFSNRSLDSLSGGERQRVMIARALAQEPSVLILDEPTNHLDIRHQLEILGLIRDLPLTIITSLHDLNMAAVTCDEVILLKEGCLLGCGKPKKVFSANAISEAFQVVANYQQLIPSNKMHLTFTLKKMERKK